MHSYSKNIYLTDDIEGHIVLNLEFMLCEIITVQ